MQAASLDGISLERYYEHFSEGSLDPRIIKLVKSITFFGIKTTASCQGHLHPDRHHFPWVGIWPPYHQDSDPKKLEVLKKIDLKQESNPLRRAFIEQKIEAIEKGMNLYQIVQEYNSSNTIKWHVDGTWLRPDMDARDTQQLISLQQDTEKLAEYIFERAKR